MNAVLRELKHATAAHHREAERHVRILDADATVAGYVRYLRRMLGFHAPMEDRFAAQPELAAHGFEPARRRKQELLRADLARLGSIAPELHCADLPATTDLAAAIGAAYVLEGSTLGGRFILSHLPARLVPLRGLATAFLEGYGPATGLLWRRFAAIAERALAGPRALACAVASAQATFDKLTIWLDEQVEIAA